MERCEKEALAIWVTLLLVVGSVLGYLGILTEMREWDLFSRVIFVSLIAAGCGKIAVTTAIFREKGRRWKEHNRG